MSANSKTMTRNKHFIVMLALFTVSFLIRLPFALSTYPFRTISDEFATISGGTILTSTDWTPTLSYTNYYGWGTTILLSPLFLFIKNPLILYRVALTAMCAIQSFVAPVCYSILVRFLNNKNVLLNCTIAFMCSFMVVTRATVVYNEHMMILMTWILVYLLLSLYQKRIVLGKKAVIESALFALILSYLLTVHIRTYVLWGALVVVYLSVLYVSKKSLLYLPSFLSTIIVLTAAFLSINSYLTDVLWRSYDTGTVGNTLESSVESLSSIALLFNPSSWLAFVGTFVSQIITISIVSCGLFALAIPLGGRLYYKYIVKKAPFNEALVPVMLVLTFCGSAILATIGIQCITWLSSSFDVILNGLTVRRDIYGTKTFTYIRYFGPYCGPVLLAIIAYFLQPFQSKEMRKDRRFVIKASAITLASFLGFFGVAIFPYLYISNSTQFTEAFFPFGLLSVDRNIDKWTYLVLLVILVGGFILACLLLTKGKTFIVCLALSVCLVYQYGYNALYYDRPVAVNSFTRVNSLYDILQTTNIIENVDGPVYYYDTNTKGHQTFVVAQYILGDTQLIPVTSPDEISTIETDIFLSNIENAFDMWREGYSQVTLDENEFIYVRGEPRDYLASLGYEFYDDMVFTWSTQYSLSEMERNGFYLDGKYFTFLREGELQFGPYIDLYPGTYQITVDGYNFDSATFSVTSNQGQQEHEGINIKKRTEAQIVYQIALDDYTVDLEFLCMNTGGGVGTIVMVNSISLEQVE